MHTYQSECDPSCSRYKNQHNATGHISLNSLHNCVTLAVDYATQTIRLKKRPPLLHSHLFSSFFFSSLYSNARNRRPRHQRYTLLQVSPLEGYPRCKCSLMKGGNLILIGNSRMTASTLDRQMLPNLHHKMEAIKKLHLFSMKRSKTG